LYIALISDIHANLQALEAVEQDARQLADQASHSNHGDPELRFWCLGDVFGRGPSPGGVWNLVTNEIKPECWVVGNHDQEIVRLINDPALISDKAKRRQWENAFGSHSDADTLVRHCNYLHNIGRANEIKRQIENLPAMLSPLPGVYLAHGNFGLNQRPLAERAQECVEGYIKQHYDVTTTWEALDEFIRLQHPSALSGIQRIHQTQWEKPSVMIVGHWHLRNFYKFEGGKWHPSIVINDSRINVWMDLPNNPAEPILINPGSVGSPRLPKDHTMSKDLCASYAMLDWGERHSRVMFRRVQYNRRETVRLLQAGMYPEQVYARLEGNCAHAHSHQCPWCVKES